MKITIQSTGDTTVTIDTDEVDVLDFPTAAMTADEAALIADGFLPPINLKEAR